MRIDLTFAARSSRALRALQGAADSFGEADVATLIGQRTASLDNPRFAHVGRSECRRGVLTDATPLAPTSALSQTGGGSGCRNATADAVGRIPDDTNSRPSRPRRIARRHASLFCSTPGIVAIESLAGQPLAPQWRFRRTPRADRHACSSRTRGARSSRGDPRRGATHRRVGRQGRARRVVRAARPRAHRIAHEVRLARRAGNSHQRHVSLLRISQSRPRPRARDRATRQLLVVALQCGGCHRHVLAAGAALADDSRSRCAESPLRSFVACNGDWRDGHQRHSAASGRTRSPARANATASFGGLSTALASVAVDRVFDAIVVLLLLAIGVVATDFPTTTTILRLLVTHAAASSPSGRRYLVAFYVLSLPELLIRVFELVATGLPRWSRSAAQRCCGGSRMGSVSSAGRAISSRSGRTLAHWLIQPLVLVGVPRRRRERPLAATLIVQGVIVILLRSVGPRILRIVRTRCDDRTSPSTVSAF